jgi:hypothetical protein
MTQREVQLNWNALGSGVLSIGAGLLVMFVWIRHATRAGINERSTFVALAVITFAMCILGSQIALTRLGWLHPITIVGSILGTVLVLLIAGVLAGWNLPLITSDGQAFMALAALTFLKWILSWAGRLFLHGWAGA